MRFLIAIKDTSIESKNNLQIGVKIAKGFSADISVIYVGHKPKGIIASEVAMTRRSLTDWNIHHPGLELLHWAFDSIKEFGYIEGENVVFDPKNLIEDRDRIRMIIPQSSGTKIRLILREGDILTELKKETEFRNYELSIIRKPVNKRHTHKLIQFLDTSILIVNNFKQSWNYKILLCVDDSPATKRAVIFGTGISQHFNAQVEVLTVSKRKNFGKGYRLASRWAQKYLSLHKIPHTIIMKVGNPTEVFVKEAETDHIIIMGKDTKNEFCKFFCGSKPIHTAQKAKCPVLIVKS